MFLNNRSSHGSDTNWQKEIESQLFRSRLEILKPNDFADFHLELERAIRDRVDVVISVGGDGTAHHLVQRLCNTSTALLVIPTGTANDFATELGIKGHIQEAIHCVRENSPIAVDAIRINGRLMITNGGLGLAAKVAQDINRMRKRVPFFKTLMGGVNHQIYTMDLAWRLLFRFPKPTRYLVETDHGRFEWATSLLLINNQRTLAGDFEIAPLTKNNDGRFNVTAFTHSSQAQVVRAIARIKMHRNPANDPFLQSMEATFAKISLADSSMSPIPFFGDGELWDSARSWEIEIVPNAFRVFCPAKKNIEQALADAGLAAS